MALLDGLDDVPWNDLRHAYGRAAQVPLLLRALVEPSLASSALAADTTPMGIRRERDQRSDQEVVVGRLTDALYHQESRYPASVRAIPFLAEILRDGPDDGKLQALLLDLLLALGVGCTSDSFPSRRFAVEPSEGDDDDDEDRWGNPVAGRHEMACYAAVQAELSTVERFVTHTLEAPALCAIALLTFFPEHAARSRDVLRVIVEDESMRLRPLRVACSLLARANLGDTTVRAAAESLLEHRDRMVVIHAACASILADQQNVSADALRVLREARAHFEHEPSPFTWTIGTLVRHCLRCVPRDR